VQKFFRTYDAFLSSEERQSDVLTRLDARYHAIIEHGHSAIKGARILDIASHNGRWSLAALCSGAEYVLGIEARHDLVAMAHRYMKRYGISQDRYRFVVGDVHEEIRRLEPGQFDTILCLGFFYHTMHHFYLLQQFQRLAPKHLILDTAINSSKGYEVLVTREDTSNYLMAAGKEPWAWVGRLSGPLLEDALTNAGFEVSYFDWSNYLRNLGEPCPGVTNTRYGDGTRVTIHAQRSNGSSRV
jgi:2-polyprenyl-3-methyl-5-hydroxy-6-metoxy-1,4-benzoquinol methylase